MPDGRTTSNIRASDLCGSVHISNGWACVRRLGHKGSASGETYWRDPDAYGKWHASVVAGRYLYWPPEEGRRP